MGGRGVGFTVKQAEGFCDIDMAHPLSFVMKFRKRRWEHDRLKLYRAAAQRRLHARRVRVEAKFVAYRSDLARGVRELGQETFLTALREVLNVRPHPG